MGQLERGPASSKREREKRLFFLGWADPHGCRRSDRAQKGRATSTKSQSCLTGLLTGCAMGREQAHPGWRGGGLPRASVQLLNGMDSFLFPVWA